MTSMANAIKRNEKTASIIQPIANIKITQLVINGLGAYTHILWWNESDEKKLGVPGLKTRRNVNYLLLLLLHTMIYNKVT